jgi:hypothetical protein
MRSENDQLEPTRSAGPTVRPPNAGKGRRKGVPNKVTTKTRELIVRFISNNEDRIQELYDRLCQEDPGRAFDFYIRLVQFVVPKLWNSNIADDFEDAEIIEQDKTPTIIEQDKTPTISDTIK